SGFLRFVPDAERKSHMEEVREASRMLHKQIIPAFAIKLVEHVREEWRYYNSANSTLGADDDSNNGNKEGGGGDNLSSKKKKNKDKKPGKNTMTSSRSSSISAMRSNLYLHDFRLKQLLHGEGINLRH